MFWTSASFSWCVLYTSTAHLHCNSCLPMHFVVMRSKGRMWIYCMKYDLLSTEWGEASWQINRIGSWQDCLQKENGWDGNGIHPTIQPTTDRWNVAYKGFIFHYYHSESIHQIANFSWALEFFTYNSSPDIPKIFLTCEELRGVIVKLWSTRALDNQKINKNHKHFFLKWIQPICKILHPWKFRTHENFPLYSTCLRMNTVYLVRDVSYQYTLIIFQLQNWPYLEEGSGVFVALCFDPKGIELYRNN